MVIDVRLPKVAEGGASAVIARVLVTPGEQVAKDQAIVEVETEKAVVEVPSTAAGIVQGIHVRPGDEVHEHDLLITLEATEQAAERPAERETPAPLVSTEVSAEKDRIPSPPPAPPPPPIAPAAAAVTPRTDRIVPASPSVRRLARELGVPIDQVVGTGPSGRITKEDVRAFVRKRLSEVPARASLPRLPDFSRFGPVHREPLNNVRRTMARHLAETWPVTPQVTHMDEADATELEALRQRFSPRIERLTGAKLTMTALLLKIVGIVLLSYPRFRASLDLDTMELIYKDYIHVGVAVDTERGLVVPVIRDVAEKSVQALAVELQAVAERARAGKLTPDDMQGAVFSISNLGSIGGTAFTPVVNGPEVAILGVARLRRLPRYVGDSAVPEPRLVLPLCLSYDHRVIDGAEGARFVRAVVEYIEHPFLLALEG